MKILVVEDEIDIRNLIKISLEEESYFVITAGDGIEALSILKETPVDLAILYIMMPRLDGFNLLRRIR